MEILVVLKMIVLVDMKRDCVMREEEKGTGECRWEWKGESFEEGERRVVEVDGEGEREGETIGERVCR